MDSDVSGVNAADSSGINEVVGVVKRRARHSGALALGSILCLSAFLQFYRLDSLQSFHGDEGSLVLAVRALVLQHQPPAYGLALAVGSAHLGPLFDYLIALPLWLSGFNPTAAVALNGVCQVIAVGLCCGLLARHGGGRVAGLVGALVLATAQEVVYYSRFLWPNMLPCLVLLMFWSLLALSEGRQYHLALLGVWLGIALQLQPTAVLLLPFLTLYFYVFRPQLGCRRYALLGLLALLALFAPSIIHDVTHGLVETRAWLAYSHHGNGGTRAVGPTLARVLLLLQRLVGVRQPGPAAVLGMVLLLGVSAKATLPSGGMRAHSTIAGARVGGAPLARLLLLYSGVYLAGYLFFGSQLRPHYAMPLFPVPALALGLLAGRLPALHMVGGPRTIVPQAVRGAAVVLALILAGSNVAHTWQASFLPDRFQITLRPDRSNLITLAQMRQVSAFIVLQAGGQRFNLLFTAPDDTVDAYSALLLAAGGHLSGHPAPLRFVVVQPPRWPAAQWPSWVRRLVACAGQAPERFTAALVWTARGATACPASHPAPAGNVGHARR